MISIGERIKRAIDDMGRGEFMFALEQASIAIDMTAKNHFNKPSNSDIYKNLLKEYSWLLELMSLPGVNLDESKFGNFPFTNPKNKRSEEEPSFQYLMYHVVRCGLIHGEKSNLRFHQDDSICLGKDILILPIRIVWGLLGLAVFCSGNKNEKTADGYFLSIFEQKYTINGWWGMDEIIRMQYKEHIENYPRVKLNITKDHFYRLPEIQKNS